MRSRAATTHGLGWETGVRGILTVGFLSLAATLSAQGVFSHSTSLSAGAMFPVGNNYGYSIVAADDLNLDGHLDLAVAVPFFQGVLTNDGNGSGGFSPGSVYFVGAEPLSVITEDLNEDGRPDIVTCNGDAGTISIVVTTPTGQYPPVIIPTGSKPVRAYSSDLNEDGHLDLVVVDEIDSTVGLLLGTGNATFQPIITSFVEVDDSLESLTIADLNHDDHLDLAIPCPELDMVAILMGNGDGSFQTPQVYSVGQSPGPLAIEDFNGDGTPDILVPNRESGGLAWLRGIGDGSFANSNLVSTVGNPVLVKGFEGHGWAPSQAAFPIAGVPAFGVITGLQTSNSNPTIETIPTSFFPDLIETGDFNEDGLEDLVVGSRINGIIEVYFRAPNQEPFRRGDVDASGHLNLVDAILLIDRLFDGTQLPCEVAADANADERFDLSDPLALVGHIFLSAPPLPAPGPDCGTDPAAPPSVTCPTGCP